MSPLLEEDCTTESSRKTGRIGMPLWNILVLGVLRLSLNIDYDRLMELANNHITIRQMLGHGGIFDTDHRYALQTIKDNIGMLNADTLCKINDIVVGSGHRFVGLQENSPLRGKADSYVFETNIDFPTDIKLSYDALRNAIRVIVVLCSMFNLPGWREHKAIVNKIRRLGRKVTTSRRSKLKSDKGKKIKQERLQKAYNEYIEYAIKQIAKIEATLDTIPVTDFIAKPMIAEIKMFVDFAKLQNEQMFRRVILGEKIPNNEKIFSVFEEYTEWISKGKAGVRVEFGVKVCILEDQYGFILHHRIMHNETDSGIAVDFIKDSQERFPALRMCSFDKGFHSPSNQRDLAELLDLTVLPKKGKRNKSETDREHQEEFVKARYQHSAVESAINALEVHGLDRCPDRGLEHFNNYVALGILGRNLHQLGCKIRNKAREEAENRKLQRAA
jgi:IS5 family transposase